MPGVSRNRGAMPSSQRAVIHRSYALFCYTAFLAASAWGVMFLADWGPLPTVDSPRSGPAWWAVLVDVGLWLMFGLQHSVMARTSTKRRLTRLVPAPLERSTYVLTTGLALGLLFWQWRALPAAIWQVDAQPWAAGVWTVYGAGWAIAVAATFMTDHREFLGLRQAGWFAGQRIPQLPGRSTTLNRRWLYARVRHPMMAGLLLAFWATPEMTAGRLLFAVAGSAYIAVGVHFEERDLRRRYGAAYRQYTREVPRFVPRLSGSPGRPGVPGRGPARAASR